MMAPRAHAKGLFVASMVDAGLCLAGWSPTPRCCGRCSSIWSATASSSRRNGYVIIDALSVKGKGGGRTLEIQVRDTGIGIPNAALPHLFRGVLRRRTQVFRGVPAAPARARISRRIMDRLDGTDVDSVARCRQHVQASRCRWSRRAKPGRSAGAPRPQVLAGRRSSSSPKTPAPARSRFRASSPARAARSALPAARSAALQGRVNRLRRVSTLRYSTRRSIPAHRPPLPASCEWTSAFPACAFSWPRQ